MHLNSFRAPLTALAVIAALVTGGFFLSQKAVQSIKHKVEQTLGPDSEVGEVRVSLTGIEILNLRVKAPKSTNLAWPVDDELRATRIMISLSIFDLMVGKMVIDTLRIENGYLAMLRAADGKLHLLPGLLAPEVSKTSTNGNNSPEPAKQRETFIKRVELVNGALEFFDTTLRAAPHKVRLEQIDAVLGRLKLPDLSGISTLDLAGTLKGTTQDGKITLAGTIELANMESGLTARLRNVDLVTLQAYLLRANEGEVKGGALDLDLNIAVRKGILHAPGTLTLRNIELSSANGTVMGMPRLVVIGASKLRNGKITLKFTLSGDIRDSRFSLNESLAAQLGASLANSLGISIDRLGKNSENIEK